MRTPRRTTRRALLAGFTAATLAWPLSACDLPGPTPRGATGRDGDDALPGEQDPDRRRVEAAVAQADELLALVGATRAAHPRLADDLAPLAECHRAHLTALGAPPAAAPSPTAGTTAGPTADPDPTSVPGTAAAALRHLLAQEQAHATALGTEAGVAASGALARLLASMDAGVQMHLAALGSSAPLPSAPPPTPTTAVGDGAVTALQAALTGQHGAVHLLGHLGGVVDAGEEPALHDLVGARHRWHRELRDQFTAVLRDAGRTPAAAAPAYVLPEATSVAAIRAEGARTEERSAQAYAHLVASSSDDLRAVALRALVDAARAQVIWGDSPVPFPGAPELEK